MIMYENIHLHVFVIINILFPPLWSLASTKYMQLDKLFANAVYVIEILLVSSFPFRLIDGDSEDMIYVFFGMQAFLIYAICEVCFWYSHHFLPLVLLV